MVGTWEFTAREPSFDLVCFCLVLGQLGLIWLNPVVINCNQELCVEFGCGFTVIIGICPYDYW